MTQAILGIMIDVLKAEDYELLEPETVTAYIDAREDLAARVDTSTLDVTEIGDGNLNLVFLCRDADGRGLVRKQALPYVRLVGPSWPFTPYRAVAEARAYAAVRPPGVTRRAHGRRAPRRRRRPDGPLRRPDRVPHTGSVMVHASGSRASSASTGEEAARG